MSRPTLVFKSSPEASESATSVGTPARQSSSPWAAGSGTADEGLDAFASEAAPTAIVHVELPLNEEPRVALEPRIAVAVRQAAEAAPIAPGTHGGSPSRRASLVMAVAVFVSAVAIGYLLLARGTQTASEPSTPAVATGQAQFDSLPPGADVVIDGQVRGQTPLKLALPVGAHTLEIRGASGSRSLPLTIEAGVVISQYVELNTTPTVLTGVLEVVSDPPGARVSLDGVDKGVAPVRLDAVEAREHVVSLTRGGSTVYRTVRVTPGASASVAVAMNTASNAVGGYVALTTPFEVQVLEGGRLIGTSRSERLMMPAGRHELDLVNAALQFRAAVTVNVEPGRVVSPTVAIPEGTLSVNALPWADVTIDGRSVGTTPLANLRLPIGAHEVVWKHPDMGERRQTVSITEQTPARVGVNFTQ